MPGEVARNAGMEFKENCGVCGKPLVYAAEAVPVRCTICGAEDSAMIYCPEGHYICDSCHQRGTLDDLVALLEASVSTSPAELLELAMSRPAVPMHGPEHHAMVPGVIVAAVRNAGYPVPRGAIARAVARGSRVPGGWCGACGDCGAAVGVGIAVSVLTGATPLTGPQRSLAMAATTLAMERMLDDGPRCCKRASRTAVEAAIDFLEARMGISLERDEKSACRYADRNRECIREKCPYYPDSK